jgi:uncharacterized protein (TIGR02117 family)
VPNCAKESASIPWWPRLRRWLGRTALLFALFWLVYGCFLLLGFVPVNRGYQVPPAEDRVRIFIRSSDIHTDFVLPISATDAAIDWSQRFPPRHLKAPFPNAKYVAIGWGSRSFYVETPTWADLKISTLFTTLFTPSESVLHVEYLGNVTSGPTMHEVLLSRQQYEELAAFVNSTIGEADETGAARLATEVSYSDYDRFYLAHGRYHMFNTCNQWTGRGLSRAGVPTGIWTPLVMHVRFWLPKVAGVELNRWSSYARV